MPKDERSCGCHQRQRAQEGVETVQSWWKTKDREVQGSGRAPGSDTEDGVCPNLWTLAGGSLVPSWLILSPAAKD